MERVTRIELALSAWEADVLPLNYTRGGCQGAQRPPDYAPRASVLVASRPCCSPTATSVPSSTSGRVGLDPFDAGDGPAVEHRRPAGPLFRVFENHRYPHIDPAVEQPDLTRLVEPEGDEPFILHPGEFALASTYEVVTLPDDVAGRLEGKSSLGRLGLLTHSTAGFIDPGFSGHVTLELSNVATLPIKLWPGMKIGQLCLFRLSSPAEHPYGSAVYGSRYQGQRGPTPSKSFQNFHRTPITPS